MGKPADFKDFLMQGNLITLAVAFVMGVAFAAVLSSFVADLIMPIIGAIFGKTDFSSLTFTIHNSLFKYGSFITALITFATIAAAVFFFVVKPYEMVTARRKAPRRCTERRGTPPPRIPRGNRQHQPLIQPNKAEAQSVCPRTMTYPSLQRPAHRSVAVPG